MDAAAIGVAQKEDRERGIDQADIFHRVVLFLPTIIVRLFRKILGVDDTPFRAVMGTRGDTGTEGGGGHGCRILRQRRDHSGRVGF